MSDTRIKVGDVFDWQVSRREFLGAGAVAVGGLALGSLAFAQPAAGQSQQAGRAASYSPPVKFDREVYTLCEQCVWRCGLRAKVLDGKVYKLDGNPQHPHSNGMLCPRGQAGVATLYDPDRLQFPMMRAGDRGSGLWKRISWDEALAFTAGKMLSIKQQFGAEAMVFSSTHNLAQTQFENLLHAFGSPNYGTQRSLCFNAMIMANLMTFGLKEPDRDYSAAKYIIYTGRNLMDAISNSETQDLVAAIARGAKVVVLDPRFTKTAAKASEWLPIRPGTDLAFFLAILNVVSTEGLYNRDFVARYTIGFDEVAQSVKAYTPEWAASKTEIPAATIRRIAREFAIAAPHAFAHPNWRTSNFVNSFQAERAISILNALVGNWAQPGGLQPSNDISSLVGSPPQPPYP
ncbi:MAG TPA: molybdopterin-dependent oxidoreductase, partial [Anaerolineae bacterium]